jgi:alkanesulfonate monooxygenase SsuD/methylene tetrahydromethanopterin reductase-like flavin-dependent oxidoreductase (luciferase family)
MYPRRVFVGIGSGESLNESPLGRDWPSPRQQLEALEEALHLIRRLWNGERVTHDGKFFRTKDAVLWSRPADDDAALEGARVWKGAAPEEYYADDRHDPKQMHEHAEQEISDEEFKLRAIVSSDPEEHVERIEQIEKLGATIVGLMNISGADPMGAVRVYQNDVLPKLRS